MWPVLTMEAVGKLKGRRNLICFDGFNPGSLVRGVNCVRCLLCLSFFLRFFFVLAVSIRCSFLPGREWNVSFLCMQL